MRSCCSILAIENCSHHPGMLYDQGTGMNPDDLPLVEWLREYLREYFPGQALNVRALGIDTLVVDVMDPTGQPRELTFSIDELPYRKATPTRSTNIIKFPSR